MIIITQKFFFLCVILIACPQGITTSAVGNVLDAACRFCVRTLTAFNQAVDSEQFVKDGINFCRNTLPEGVISDVCVRVVGKTLHQVYAFLKLIEPKPSLCYDIRLCSTCANVHPTDDTPFIPSTKTHLQ
uniref:Saposin B-type domain-containing protein n=1 Tax=Panagrellus redivivus TaxID=6233 RepID=A0A7E4UXV0_PANRE